MLERLVIAKSFGLHIPKPKKIPGNICFDIFGEKGETGTPPLGQGFRTAGLITFFGNLKHQDGHVQNAFFVEI